MRSKGLDNPDLEFSNYVARQLGGEGLADTLVTPRDPSVSEACDVSESPDGLARAWETHGDGGGGERVRKRRLAFEQTTRSAHATGSAVSWRGNDEGSASAGDSQAEAGGGRAGREVREGEMSSVLLLLEDALEAHEHASSAHGCCSHSCHACCDIACVHTHTRTHTYTHSLCTNEWVRLFEKHYQPCKML